jgi:hypothetical protein
MKQNRIHPRPALLGLLSAALFTCTLQAQQSIEGADPFNKAAAGANANPAQSSTAETLDAQARVLFARGETEKAIALQQNAVEQAKKTLEKCNENLARYQGKPVKDGPIMQKLREIIIPKMDFEDCTLEEAVDFLRLRCIELDSKETDPNRKGVNFIIAPLAEPTADPFASDPPKPGTRRRLIQSLKLSNVPISEALKYICQATGTRFEIDDFAVNILDGAK